MVLSPECRAGAQPAVGQLWRRRFSWWMGARFSWLLISTAAGLGVQVPGWGMSWLWGLCLMNCRGQVGGRLGEPGCSGWDGSLEPPTSQAWSPGVFCKCLGEV